MIEFEKEGRTAVIRINRPEALGALTVKGHDELADALKAFRDDDELLAGILTGTGDKAFCTGVDIKDMLPFIKRTANKPWQQVATLMRGMDLWKPMIAAVNGLALGGGLEMALGCDIRIASEKAKFGFPEVKVGMFPAGGGTQRLPRLIPPGLAAEMILTGKLIDAQEALRVGLVNKIVPLEKLMSTAKEISQSICEAGPLAVRTAKEAMVRGMSLGLEEGLRFEAMLTPRVVLSKDFEEGIIAFAEKRKPVFRGE
ncbi:MAG: enoyl-CoA hydratase-related protein [Thermodesulfobacteriota bacterium]